MKISRILSLGLAFVSIAHHLFGGDTTAPLLAPHNITAEIEASYFEGSHFWDKGGKTRKAYNTLRRYMAEITFEKGLSSQDNISVYVSYADIREKIHKSEDDFGDAEIGYKRKLMGGEDQVLSAELRAIVPVGAYVPELRYGCFGMQAGLLYAKCLFFCGKRVTVDSALFLRGYSDFPSDQARGHLYGFLDWNERLQLKVALEGVFGFYNGKSPKRKSFFFYNANYRVLQGELSLKGFISDRVALYGGVRGPFLGGNYGKGAVYFLGFDFCLR